MQHKWTVLFTALILTSLLVAPAGTVRVHAQTDTQEALSNCPPYEPGILKEKDFLRSLPVECIKAYRGFASQTTPPEVFDLNAQNAQPEPANSSNGFGYSYGGTTYNYILAEINSGLTGDDEFMGPIDLGFSFPFYGTQQTQLYFNTNGLITFGAGSRAWVRGPIPQDVNPDNLIAPFWENFLVGSPYNTGAIYYSRGGSAPNRYFVVEWRSIENYTADNTFSFEAIMYENGDVVFQYVPFPSSALYYSTIGIEDSTGYDGLQYQHGNYGVGFVSAIRFFYPRGSTVRMLAYPLHEESFAPLNGNKDFTILVKNTGEVGTDTYDLSVPAAGWSGTYYEADGATPLSDTDGDLQVDTGPIPSGASTTIIARYVVPAGATVGDQTGDLIKVTSSLNTSASTNVRLRMSIPAPFATVLMDEANGAMSFLTASPVGTDLYKATADNYFGSGVTLAQLPHGVYLYAWNRGSPAGDRWVGNIEYALVSRNGTLVRAPARLTDNASATLYTWDDTPSVAVAPNGIIGMVWRRYLYNHVSNTFNYNIYFATLSAAGALLTGPTNITNNASWGVPGTDIAPLHNPTVTASSDNHFVMSWGFSPSLFHHNIWYAVHNANGLQTSAPKALTSNNVSERPNLNSLTGGRVILTWQTNNLGPYYAVLDSSGSIRKPATTFDPSWFDGSAVADAVQLPNGKVAVAWTFLSNVVLNILDSSYNVEKTVVSGSAGEFIGPSLSITTDASSHVIMTMVDKDSYNQQFYALWGSRDTFLTDPMPYYTSGEPIAVSWNHQWIAPYEPGNFIQGNTGIGGVTLSYTHGTVQSVTSDGAGDYLIDVPEGWSGMVTPSHPCYTFSPASLSYSNMTTDQTGQNFVATFNNAPVCAVTAGVFRPSNGLLYLKNSNTTGFADEALNYGLPGDYPVVGDWDGDGDATIGIYRNGTFFLRNSNTIGFADLVFPFGVPGDQPIAGDWDGDGVDTIGVYRPSIGLFLLRNSNDAGFAEMSFFLGNAGDVGIAGDWNGDGLDTTGVFRPSNGVIFLKNTNATGFADIALNYGLPGDKPVMGDWDNDGIDTIGIYRNGTFYLRNSNTIGFADIVFALGIPGDMPIAGNWDGLP